MIKPLTHHRNDCAPTRGPGLWPRFNGLTRLSAVSSGEGGSCQVHRHRQEAGCESDTDFKWTRLSSAHFIIKLESERTTNKSFSQRVEPESSRKVMPLLGQRAFSIHPAGFDLHCDHSLLCVSHTFLFQIRVFIIIVLILVYHPHCIHRQEYGWCSFLFLGVGKVCLMITDFQTSTQPHKNQPWAWNTSYQEINSPHSL